MDIEVQYLGIIFPNPNYYLTSEYKLDPLFFCYPRLLNSVQSEI